MENTKDWIHWLYRQYKGYKFAFILFSRDFTGLLQTFTLKNNYRKRIL